MNAFLRGTLPGQIAYDLALPPEPIDPDFSGEIGDLLTEADTHLLSFDGFARSLDEDLWRLVPDLLVVRLILAASRSSDPVMRGMVADVMPGIQEYAGEMLDATWRKGRAA